MCISTALVLILLGMVVFSVQVADNLSAYVKENLTVTLMLSEDMTNPEAQRLCKELQARPYISHLTYISKEQALEEQKAAMGTDPSEFLGVNPFVGSIELQLKADYANSDSLRAVSQALKKNPKVNEITYPQDLMDSVNENLGRVNMVLLVLAVLLTIVSFSLINNSVKLGIFARRFTIHTMKLVGATKSFIRGPFLGQSVFQGLFAALLAILMLLGALFFIRREFSQLFDVFSLDLLLVVIGIVIVSGVVICLVSTWLVVGKLVSLPKDELYY